MIIIIDFLIIIIILDKSLSFGERTRDSRSSLEPYGKMVYAREQRVDRPLIRKTFSRPQCQSEKKRIENRKEQYFLSDRGFVGKVRKKVAKNWTESTGCPKSRAKIYRARRDRNVLKVTVHVIFLRRCPGLFS